MSIIITIDEDIHILQRCITAFCVKYNLPLPAITKTTLTSLVFKLYDDKLSELLKWCTPASSFDKKLEEVLSWYATNGRDPISSAFITEVIDDLERRVRSVISKYVPTRTFKLVTLKLIREVLILSIGEDYRIIEWNHLLKTGVIKHPARRL